MNGIIMLIILLFLTLVHSVRNPSSNSALTSEDHKEIALGFAHEYKKPYLVFDDNGLLQSGCWGSYCWTTPMFQRSSLWCYASSNITHPLTIQICHYDMDCHSNSLTCVSDLLYYYRTDVAALNRHLAFYNAYGGMLAFWLCIPLIFVILVITSCRLCSTSL